jgi:hypothetical protein
MANSGSGGPPVDENKSGLIIGSTGHGEIRKMFLELPEEEANAKFAAWLRKERLDGEAAARRHLDELLAEIKFGHIDPVPVK